MRTVQREDNAFESSHPSEVVHCTLESDESLTLLCKTGPSRDQDRWGLVRGLQYEAAVYREVLTEQDPTPRFYGSWEDPQSGKTWLFLQYLGDGWRLDLGPETAIVDAAQAIGRLHRDVPEQQRSLSLLNRYDAQYFEQCLSESAPRVARWQECLPSIDQMMARFKHEFEVLLSAPQTIVHGEFTPHNVVWAEERPYFIDWEEAAIGAGEIDLACLTDDWDEDLVDQAAAAYVAARWPEGPPHDFQRALQAARLYWMFRWLADADESDSAEDVEWMMDRFSEHAQDTPTPLSPNRALTESEGPGVE
ncbi:MAG: aminoglycoside phosphotransferase family protein [Solirubrobacteraceae bacterium]